MGVRGLTSYIAQNEKTYLKPYELCNCYLVIDGKSIACRIYDVLSKGESVFGGDYDEYYDVVKKFFRVLEKCGVTPIVLMDGGYENKKIKTILSRQADKLHILRRITKSYSKSTFFPLFMKQTFFDVMEELEIICIQCDLEADGEIAAVARALKCPVLSYDSDFYIFDVLYIPFPSVQIVPVKFTDSDDYYIQCSIYNVENFLNEFAGLDKSMLPIIATVLGNDYIQSSTFQKFFHHVTLPKSKHKSHTQKKIDGILHWMKNENVESAIALILSHLENRRTEMVLKAIRTSIQDYTSNYVSESVMDKLTRQMGELNLSKKDVEAKLPSEILQLYYQGKIKKFVIDMINLGIYITKLQVEDVYNRSSHYPFLQLITDIYRMVAPYAKCKEQPLRVYLTIKNIHGPIKLQNDPSKCLDGFCLDQILKEPKETRLKLLCQIVGVSENELNIVSTNNWSIFILAFIYWLRKLNSDISFVHIHSLILMAIANEVVQKSVGYYRSVSKFMKSKANLFNKLEKIPVTVGTREDFKGMLKDVTHYEKLLIQSALIPYRTVTEPAKGKAYCISTIHLFACFQSCLLHIMQLNALLNHPLPYLKVSDFYSGTLLFNFYVTIKSKPSVEKFADNLLKEAPNLKRIYEYLHKNLCMYSEKSLTEGKNVKKKKTRKRRNKVCEKEVISFKPDDNDGFSDVNNRYSILTKVSL